MWKKLEAEWKWNIVWAKEWAEMMVWEELDAGTKKVLTMQKLDAHIIKKNSRSTSCSTK